MSLKTKARKEKQRAHAQRMHQQEQERLERERQKLKTATGGFARTERPKGFQAKATQPLRRHSSLQDLPQRMVFVTAEPAKVQPVLNEEMAKRDRTARDAIEAKKLRIHQIYTKGGLQYLTDSDMADLQSGLLRRRS